MSELINKKNDEFIVSCEKRNLLFKSLLNTLFNVDNEKSNSNNNNNNEISNLKLNREKLLILTSWFDQTKDYHLAKDPENKVIHDLTSIPFVIFTPYINLDHNMILWDVLRYLDNNSLKKYIYQNQCEICMYVCIEPKSKNSSNDINTNSVVSIDDDSLSCSKCGYFYSLDQCCPHLLLLYLYDQYSIKLEETIISNESEWLEMVRRSTMV